MSQTKALVQIKINELDTVAIGTTLGVPGSEVADAICSKKTGSVPGEVKALDNATLVTDATKMFQTKALVQIKIIELDTVAIGTTLGVPRSEVDDAICSRKTGSVPDSCRTGSVPGGYNTSSTRQPTRQQK